MTGLTGLIVISGITKIKQNKLESDQDYQV
jgi:hypothetical protein